MRAKDPLSYGEKNEWFIMLLLIKICLRTRLSASEQSYSQQWKCDGDCPQQCMLNFISPLIVYWGNERGVSIVPPTHVKLEDGRRSGACMDMLLCGIRVRLSRGRGTHHSACLGRNRAPPGSEQPKTSCRYTALKPQSSLLLYGSKDISNSIQFFQDKSRDGFNCKDIIQK